jgi:cysteine desulfurase family protein (TIGR01976 family)
VLDPARIRDRFPALGAAHGGRPVVFADAPGGTQVPDVVIEAVSGWYRRGISNTHGAFARSRATDASIAEARAAVGDLLGAPAEGIVFGQNATSLLLHVARAFARTIGPDDEIVVTALDHDANIRPWVIAARDAGATVRWVDVRPHDVTLELGSLERVLSSRTRLVAVTMASNAVGTIPPLVEVVERARSVGALVALDAVHAAQHLRVDLIGSGVDLLVASAYKVFGPHLGMLAATQDLLDRWEPDKLRPAPDRSPERWETGTQNHEALAGVIAAVDYLAELGHAFGDPIDGSRSSAIRAAFDAIGAHERALAAGFLEGIRGMSHVEVVGIADPTRAAERTPTFSLRLNGCSPLEAAERLAERGIWTWDGHHYAIELFDRLGLLAAGGSLRIGFCHYHGADEVDRVLEAVRELK